jgi:hypothetical protein
VKARVALPAANPPDNASDMTVECQVLAWPEDRRACRAQMNEAMNA